MAVCVAIDILIEKSYFRNLRYFRNLEKQKQTAWTHKEEGKLGKRETHKACQCISDSGRQRVTYLTWLCEWIAERWDGRLGLWRKCPREIRGWGELWSTKSWRRKSYLLHELKIHSTGILTQIHSRFLTVNKKPKLFFFLFLFLQWFHPKQGTKAIKA